MKTDVKFYKTKQLFLKDLKKLIPELDIRYSAYCSRFSLRVGEGLVFARNVLGMIQNMNEIIGDEVFITGRLVGRQGIKFTVYLDKFEANIKDTPSVKQPEVKVEANVVDEPTKPTEPSSEVNVVDEPTEPASEESSEVKVDWAWIGTLQDNKEDKAALKEYMNDNFNIVVKGNLKLENLVEKFKEELPK